MRFNQIMLCLVVLSLLADAAARCFASESTATAIVSDREHGIVRIMAGGHEVARFDSGGLHVRDFIDFGGVLTDIGTEPFDKQTPGARAQ